MPGNCLGIGSIWWRHEMETFSALLAICAENSPVPGEFPAQRPVTRSCDLRPNKRLSKQSRGRWFETPSRPLWRHRNELTKYIPVFASLPLGCKHTLVVRYFSLHFVIKKMIYFCVSKLDSDISHKNPVDVAQPYVTYLPLIYRPSFLGFLSKFNVQFPTFTGNEGKSMIRTISQTHNVLDKYHTNTLWQKCAHMCTFLLQNAALWNMGLVHCGIYGICGYNVTVSWTVCRTLKPRIRQESNERPVDIFWATFC